MRLAGLGAACLAGPGGTDGRIAASLNAPYGGGIITKMLTSSISAFDSFNVTYPLVYSNLWATMEQIWPDTRSTKWWHGLELTELNTSTKLLYDKFTYLRDIRPIAAYYQQVAELPATQPPAPSGIRNEYQREVAMILG